jgi:hypothetical protein
MLAVRLRRLNPARNPGSPLAQSVADLCGRGAVKRTKEYRCAGPSL